MGNRIRRLVIGCALGGAMLAVVSTPLPVVAHACEGGFAPGNTQIVGGINVWSRTDILTPCEAVVGAVVPESSPTVSTGDAWLCVVSEHCE